MRLRRIVNFDHGWTRLTILRSGNSLPGSANVLEPGFRPGVRWGVVPRWCPPIGRRIGSPSLRHLHYPAVAPGPAVSYQSFGAASVLGGNTPRALEGQGHTAIRGRPIGGPSGLGQTVGHAPNARHRSHRLLISDCNGRDPCSGAAPPGSGRFSRRDAEVRAALCWRRLR